MTYDNWKLESPEDQDGAMRMQELLEEDDLTRATFNRQFDDSLTWIERNFESHESCVDFRLWVTGLDQELTLERPYYGSDVTEPIREFANKLLKSCDEFEEKFV